jgi:hypothetical protein
MNSLADALTLSERPRRLSKQTRTARVVALNNDIERVENWREVLSALCVVCVDDEIG